MLDQYLFIFYNITLKTLQLSDLQLFILWFNLMGLCVLILKHKCKPGAPWVVCLVDLSVLI